MIEPDTNYPAAHQQRVTESLSMFPAAAAAAAIMSLDDDARWLEWVTKQFESIAGDDKEIDLDEFKTALKVKEVMETVITQTKVKVEEKNWNL